MREMAAYKTLLPLLVATVTISICAGAGLRDHHIEGDSIISLDTADNANGWTATASGGRGPLRINATVPGDLITDLQVAGLIGDPLYELNWKNATLWDTMDWTYTTTFDVNEEMLAAVAAGDDVLLVFDGIKMGATIVVNDVTLGQATDEFLRYDFSLGSSGVLRAGINTVSVTFTRQMAVLGRFMASVSACKRGREGSTRNIS